MAHISVFLGGDETARDAAIANAIARAHTTAHYSEPSTWTFARHVERDLARGPGVIVARRLEEAFPDGQTGNTRLVLTQSTYQLQRWLDWIEQRGDVSLVAEADGELLRAAAPEAFQRRGPWASVEWVSVEGAPGGRTRSMPPDGWLRRAFVTTDPGERLALCRREVDAHAGSAAAQLGLGSALMEVQDLEASQAAIERALRLSPEWEAAHYELGKLFLRRDDLERARAAFEEAGRLMPSFSAAFSNLGATLGELDRPTEALAAFEQALKYDPAGYPVLNNMGVVLRELGRLPESEAAFRQVISTAPEFVFGHYNLGHTLFLQGRYRAALTAYEGGQQRDPQKNARQACRLAIVRLAAGDADGSLRDLQRCTAGLPGGEKREILAEAQEILWALLTDRPELAGWRRVADAVKREIGTL